MRSKSIFLQTAAACLLLTLFASSALAQRAVILVRHAEKADASKDPVLSDEGWLRARSLAVQLAGAEITAIYTSEFQRTKQSAQPLAAAIKVSVQTHPASDAAGLVQRIRANHADKVVLVVGHSNTLPELMKLLGHSVMETIEDSDYGSLFILVPRTGQPPVVVRLRY